jgi:hypothetical protein
LRFSEFSKLSKLSKLARYTPVAFFERKVGGATWLSDSGKTQKNVNK